MAPQGTDYPTAPQPRLGHVPLAKLAPATLEEYFAGLNTRSAYRVFKVLRAALNHAVRLGLIMSNPTEPVTAPRRCEHHPLLWTIEETLRFLDECRRSSPPYYPVFLAAVATGARLGELLGVRWRDVDLDAGVMLIVQELDRPRGGGFRFANPKSAKSRRSVLLPQEMTDELRVLRRRQIEERLQRGPCPDGLSCKRQHCPKGHDTGLVFSQPNGKPAHGLAARPRHTAVCIRRLPQGHHGAPGTLDRSVHLVPLHPRDAHHAARSRRGCVPPPVRF